MDYEKVKKLQEYLTIVLTEFPVATSFHERIAAVCLAIGVDVAQVALAYDEKEGNKMWGCEQLIICAETVFEAHMNITREEVRKRV